MGTSDLAPQLQTRFLGYSIVGICTYVLDITILWILLTYTSVSALAALSIGFLIGVSVNFFLCYYWVYRGTKRSQMVGYTIFVGVAIIGVTFVTIATTYLFEKFGVNIYIARTFVAGAVGLVNFAINTFLNFRLH